MVGIFTKEERAVVFFLAASLTVGALAVGTGRVDPSVEPRGDGNSVEAGSVGLCEGPLRVELNSASRAELELLPGIGPARAGEIVRLRGERGGFKTVTELLDVRGIGRVTLERLRPFAVVGDTCAEASFDAGAIRSSEEHAGE